MRYGIQITMLGDVGHDDKRELVMMYKAKPGRPLETALVSQDFTALKNQKPTTYEEREFANLRAARIRIACDRLHLTLKNISTIRIVRHFIVRVVEVA